MGVWRKLVGESGEPRVPESLKQLLDGAQIEAFERGFSYVGPEHLVLAILRGSDRGVRQALDRAGFRVNELYGLVNDSMTLPRRVRGAPRRENLPWTNRIKRLLDTAAAEARLIGGTRVGPEHVLLALLHEGFDPADVLIEQGLTLEVVRAATSAHTGVAPIVAAPFVIRIDDESALPIFEQIITQVEEATATRRLHSGDRLPAVRRLADRLSIAPGTVARAYRELEARGVVTTDGTRGTRVAESGVQHGSPASQPVSLLEVMRPVVVAAFHRGATAKDLRSALESAMGGIYSD
jgi:DNA-binding transcriptional regulator YhcF (GntR family)